MFQKNPFFVSGANFRGILWIYDSLIVIFRKMRISNSKQLTAIGKFSMLFAEATLSNFDDSCHHEISTSLEEETQNEIYRYRTES